jgi:hypothetical protein
LLLTLALRKSPLTSLLLLEVVAVQEQWAEGVLVVIAQAQGHQGVAHPQNQY